MKVSELSSRDKSIYYALKATNGKLTTGIAKLLSVSTRDVTAIKKAFFGINKYSKSDRALEVR